MGIHFGSRLGLLALAAACLVATAKAGEPQTVRQLCERGVKAQLDERPAEAEQYYQRALAIADPKSLEAARIYKYRGILLEHEKRVTEAEHDFLSALIIEDKTPDAEGDHANTLQLYGGLLRDTGRGAEAEVQAELATTLRAEHLRKVASDKRCTSRDLKVRPGTRGPGPAALGSGPAAPRVEWLSAPVVLEKQEPTYTDLARLAKLQGTVLLYVLVGTDGKACNPRVVRPLGLGLDENAMAAVQDWRFEPGGKPVGATIEVNFRLL